MDTEKRNAFLSKLEHSVLIADGGMGTMIRSMAAQPVRCVEAVNLTDPGMIREIHTRFLQAGAMIIETNTFGANRIQLKRFELENKVKEINAAGVRCAKEVIRPGCFIAGSVGPFVPPIAEIAPGDEAMCREIIAEQVSVLTEEGVDLLICETFGSVRHLVFTLDVIKKLTGLPVIASVSVNPAFMTEDGFQVRNAILALAEAGADVAGLNCGHGIQVIESALEKITDIDIPISVMPNAGFPERDGARIIYGISEEYFAAKALRFAQLGARIIGGCCGITPEDISAASARLKKEKIVRKQRIKGVPEKTETIVPCTQGAFLDKIAAVKLPVICEIDPPAHPDITRNLEAILAVMEAGAHAVSMADNPLARAKIENLAFAALVRRKTDINIVLHITGRDRNLLGIRSYMLGAQVLGIEALLCVTGDPSHSQAEGQQGLSNVYDLDSIGLIKTACRLNTETGLAMKKSASAVNTDIHGFSVGAAVNQNMKDYSVQLKRLKLKIGAGARFVMTQPFFEHEKAEEFLEKTKDFGVKIFIGILPVTSAKTAEYLHNEVPGIVIPSSLRDALAKKPDDKDYQTKTGLEHAMELVAKLRSSAAGFYFISPHTNPALLAGLVKSLGT